MNNKEFKKEDLKNLSHDDLIRLGASLTVKHVADSLEKIDNVNKPSHYQGSKGLEGIEVIDNFIGNLPGKAAWCWGNAIKYLLRFQKKNGIEDLKKARKNLDWLIEEMEHENQNIK